VGSFKKDTTQKASLRVELRGRYWHEQETFLLLSNWIHSYFIMMKVGVGEWLAKKSSSG
jgi:hypothetical protein